MSRGFNNALQEYLYAQMQAIGDKLSSMDDTLESLTDNVPLTLSITEKDAEVFAEAWELIQQARAKLTHFY